MSENLLLRHESAPVGESSPLTAVLDGLPWDENGLVVAVAQQHDTGEVLMLAWMNRAALEETLATGRACYWSRSRRALWRKGETSGCWQEAREVRFDCDGDAVLVRVNQLGGGACHTGRFSCFYNRIGKDGVVVLTAPPSIQP
jgi:phosphoribosyl-AMP cyclohydrolase